jgi:nicotinamide phosphoribosyltransferase
MLTQFGKPGGLVAVVSDSYDIYNAANNIWPSLAKEITAMGGTLVIRPDSGKPSAVVLALCEILSQRFGFTTNNKGYKMLPDNIRLIQGDGINEISVAEICKTIADQGYSTDNVAFGMGGELLQTPNRDTMKFAMKASAVVVNGETVMVSKEPVGDASKKSKEGFLKVVMTPDVGLTTVDAKMGGEDYLEPVFRAGDVMRTQTFAEIRALAAV